MNSIASFFTSGPSIGRYAIVICLPDAGNLESDSRTPIPCVCGCCFFLLCSSTFLLILCPLFHSAQFLPEDIFVSKPLSVLLLLLHIGGLGYFCRQWIVAANRATGGKRIFFLGSQSQLSPIYITSTMFVSNYIGICFARTLHYQFYSWYFHALPYLLWCNSSNSTTPTAIRNEKQRFSYPFVVRIALLLAIELSFLTFPATPLSSAILQLAHMAILVPVQPPDLFWIKDDPVQEKKGR